MTESNDNPYLDVTEEIQEAIREKRAVVALESTIISHGMPNPQNVETALAVEAMVRDNGAIPATVAVLGGRLKVGLKFSEIEYLGDKSRKIRKCSRRDLPLLTGACDDGSTTVAATMIIAAMAGIKIFATGGIGGVHRNAERTMDISADLEELARTNVAVVCAGVKSVLDIRRTLEYLETRGVPVIGYRCDNLPAFYSRDSGLPLDHRASTPSEIASIINAKWNMRLRGGLVIGNPVPAHAAIEPAEIDTAIEAALDEMEQRGISGKDATPFLLSAVAERTGGRSLEANVELVLNNARLAAQVATLI